MKKRPPEKKKRRFKVLDFFGGITAELKKVTWPSRQDTMRLSAVALILCLILGIVLGGFDYLFMKLVEHIFLP
jgi:preprotein translocase subunit SecE